MKVLQVYKDYYPPVTGGIEGHLNLLSRGLAERGIDVEVLVSNTGPKKTTGYDNGIPITRVPEFGRLVKQHAKINVLFEMVDFRGWKAAALWDDIKFDLKHFAGIERLAMVGEKQW